MKKILLLALLLSLFTFSCAKKKTDTLTIRVLRDSKVALTDINGPQDARLLVETALANEVIENGRFQIIDRATVRDAYAVYPSEVDRARLGKKVGADYVLWINVDEFKLTDRDGFDVKEVEDSVITEEQHAKDPIKTKRYDKVQASEGLVRLTFYFLSVEKDEIIAKQTTEAHDSINSRDFETIKLQKDKEDGKQMGELFYSRMGLLERLTNQAVSEFFNHLSE